MIINYFILTFRHMKKNFSYAFINILGLAIGLAAAILISLFVTYELDYNKSHEKVDRTFMVVRDAFFNGQKYYWNSLPFRFASIFKEEVPEVEKAAQLMNFTMLLKYDDKLFNEPVLAAGPDLFDILTFNLISGDHDAPLPDKYSISLSENVARKYFPDGNAVGQTFQGNNEFSLTVSSVYENLPPNSSHKPNVIVHADILKDIFKDWNLESLQNNSFPTLVLLKEGADLNTVVGKIEPRLAQEQIKDVNPDKLFLHPYKDLYLHKYKYEAGGPIQQVYIFIAIGVIIMLLAGVNYVNLVTARSVKRAKEIGVRKTFGASKTRIVAQFLGESVLFALIALIIAIIVVELLLPVINSEINKQLIFDWSNYGYLAAVFASAILIGLLSGLYPAFYLAKFDPAYILKGLTNKEKGSFKSALVVFQFAASIALIICSVILYMQFNYLTNYDIGMKKEGLIYFYLNDDYKKGMESIRATFKEVPEVEEVTFSSNLPISIWSNGWGYEWEGKNPDDDVLVSNLMTDNNFINTTGIELKEGRYFLPGEVTLDTTNKVMKVVINETFANVINKPDLVGNSIKRGDYNYEIIGVIKDFNFLQLSAKTEPLCITHNPEYTNYGMVKVSGNVTEIKSVLDSKLRETFPAYPADVQFLENTYNNSFNNQKMQASIYGYFTLLAIFISCLGLFGLASFLAEQKRKEISIRKVLGSGNEGIYYLMMKIFVRWVGMATILGWPVAWYYGDTLLKNYVHRIDMPYYLFPLAGLAAILIAILTVAFQVYKATRENPAVVLKEQ
jgi:putative ABC transport system permease protein